LPNSNKFRKHPIVSKPFWAGRPTTFAQLKRASPFSFVHPVNRLYIVLCNFRWFRNLLEFGKHVVILTALTKLLHLCGSSLIPPSGLLPAPRSFSCAVPLFKPYRRLWLAHRPNYAKSPKVRSFILYWPLFSILSSIGCSFIIALYSVDYEEECIGLKCPHYPVSRLTYTIANTNTILYF